MAGSWRGPPQPSPIPVRTPANSVSGHGLRLNFQRILSPARPKEGFHHALVNFGDLESLVGTEVGVSPWHQITQSADQQVRRGDRRPPVDPRRCRARHAGNWAAHHRPRLSDPVPAPHAVGHRSCAWKASAAASISAATRCASPTWCPSGSKVRLRQKCLGVERRAGGKQMMMESTIEIEGKDRPACVAESISIIYGG